MSAMSYEMSMREHLSKRLSQRISWNVDLEFWETGGACTALALRLPDHKYLMITAAEDAVVPADGEPIMVGWYLDAPAGESLYGDEPYALFGFASEEHLLHFATYAASMFMWGEQPESDHLWQEALKYASDLSDG